MSPRTFEFGPLEMEILGILQQAGEPLSVTQVQAQLKSAGQDLAYTTVMTVLSRLQTKGALARDREGRQFLYSVAQKKRDVGSKILSQVTRSLFRADRVEPILALLRHDEDLTREDLDQLRAAVDERIKDLKRPQPRK